MVQTKAIRKWNVGRWDENGEELAVDSDKGTLRVELPWNEAVETNTRELAMANGELKRFFK